MVTYVTMPKLALAMKEGTVVDWFKKENEKVEKGEPLLQIETMKTISDVEAPESGILRKIVAPKGSEVLVGELLAVIAGPQEELTSLPEKLQTVKTSTETPVEERAERIDKATTLLTGEERIQVSPLVKKLAKEHGIDLCDIKGTGPNGMIVKEDLLRVIDTTKPNVSTDLPTRPAPSKPTRMVKSVPLTAMGKAIAERLSQSYSTAVHTTMMIRVDSSEMIRFRKEFLENNKTNEIPLTYTGILVKAVAKALKSHPIVNSQLEGNEIKMFSEINVGVAIALEEGLIVPVIPDADEKDLSEIAICLRELTEKAKKHSLSIDEVAKGTFTITNLGMYGIETFLPIINPPQSAILSVGMINEQPVVIDGQITVRPIMNLSFVWDHRVFGGVEAAKFLQTMKRILEEPCLLTKEKSKD